jgi:hypothetical protein
VKTIAPEVRYKTYINKRTGRVEQVPEGVDPAFNWHVGKANRGGMGAQALEGARNRYAKTTTGQTIQGILDQALSAAPGPPSPYEKPILITRKQTYDRLSLDEAIHRELGYLQDETRKTGKEYMSLVVQGGNRLLGTWSSGKTSTKIFLADEIRHILRTQGRGTLYLLHSHPNNTFFSANDLAIMCCYESIAEMKVILSNGDVYVLSVGEGERLKTGEELADLFKVMDGLKGLTNEEKLHRIKKQYRWS